MKLFDSEFEKLLKEDPNGERRKQKKKNSSDEEDVVLGRLPKKLISNSSCSSQPPKKHISNTIQNEVSTLNIPSQGYRKYEVTSSRTPSEISKLNYELNYELNVSIGTEVLSSDKQTSTIKPVYSDAEVQTDSTKYATESVNTPLRPSSARSLSAFSSQSSFDNGGVVLDVNDTSEVDFVKSLGQDFILVNRNPTNEELNTLQKLPKAVGLYLATSNDLISYLLPGTHNCVYYNSPMKRVYPLDNDLTQITEEKLKFLTNNFDYLQNEKRTFNNIKYGSLITDNNQLFDISRKTSFFLIYNPKFDFKNFKNFKNLPQNLPFFVVSNREVVETLFPEIDFSNNLYFYRKDDSSLIKAENIDSAFDVENFLEENNYNNNFETRTINNIKYGTIIKIKADLASIKASKTEFLLFDHIPNKNEINAIRDIPFFICIDEYILKLFNCQKTGKNIFKFTKEDEIETYNDVNDIQYKENKKIDDLVYGSLLEFPEDIQKVLKSNKNVIFISENYENKEIFEDLPENCCFFEISNQNLFDYFSDGYRTKTGMVMYRSVDGKCFDMEKTFSKEKLSEFIQNHEIEPIFNSDDREFNYIKFGSLIRTEKKLNSISNNYFVLNHIPRQKEIAMFKYLPSNVGYFVVTAPKLLEKYNIPNDDENHVCFVSNNFVDNIDFNLTSENLSNYLKLFNLSKLHQNLFPKDVFNKVLDINGDCFIVGPQNKALELKSQNENLILVENQNLDDNSIVYIPRYMNYVVPYHDLINLESFEKFLKSKEKKFENLEFGTRITSEDVKLLKEKGYSFYLVNDSCNLTRIPPMIGYFLVDDEILRENYQNNGDIKSLYYCSKNQRWFPFNSLFIGSEIHEFLSSVYQQEPETKLNEINDERMICSLNFGKILSNEKEIKELQQSNCSFFLFNCNPSERILQIFQDLPFKVGFYLIQDKSLLKTLDSSFNDFPENKIVFYNSKTSQIVPFDSALTELSFWSFTDSQLFSEYHDVQSYMSMSLRHVYNGSFVVRPSHINLILNFDFFLFSYKLNDDDKEVLSVLPDSVHYFICPSNEVMKFVFPEYEPKSNTLFYNHRNNMIIDFSDELNKENLLKLLYDQKILIQPPQAPSEEKSMNPRFANRNQSYTSKIEEISPSEDIFDSDDYNDVDDETNPVGYDSENEVEEKNTKLENSESNETDKYDKTIESESSLLSDLIHELDYKIQQIGRDSTVRLSLRDLADQANQIFEREEIPVEEIEDDILHKMIDSSDIEEIMEYDEEEDNTEEKSDENEDPFAQFETNQPDSEEKVEKKSSRKNRKSKIPLKQRKTHDDIEIEDTTENIEEKELNKAIEDEILGQSSIPDDVPRDIFGFPSTKPYQMKKINEKFSDLKSLWLIIKRRYIALSKKGHSHFPWTRDRAEAISNLIERQRKLHELAFYNRRIRALTRANLQLRTMPEVGYTRLIRNREGRRLELSILAANKRIEILRKATSVDENGRSQYMIENEIEKQRVKMLVNLSKRKKAVNDLQLEVNELSQTLADLERRISLMTQKDSIYTKFFTRKVKPPEETRVPTAPRARRH
ncbi:hypothetical protein TVAGG3_0649800 [Trichomonas vaginalis G3]|uniref:hypothetical protein n=1 Tax=Trichomonas vaginalis (strain ATCC PRA-98 / G3) TaxID=412133 RepID=UPI0021E543FB|nr:hypothetical protein TVAGG3_0649800 [Trichomonas vaginalis G3]KAI5505766.1 hypothetical protein TVAGG3_0649800 [Trichomonas vaginalis G3]